MEESGNASFHQETESEKGKANKNRNERMSGVTDGETRNI